jgi:hypothetical protein
MYRANPSLFMPQSPFSAMAAMYCAEDYLGVGNTPVDLPGVPSTMRAVNDFEEDPRGVMETKIVKNLITSYFNIVRKNINDTVTKSIMAFLVLETKRSCYKELI